MSCTLCDCCVYLRDLYYYFVTKLCYFCTSKLILMLATIITAVCIVCRCSLLDIDGGSSDKFSTSFTTGAAMLAYTPAQLRSLCPVKAHLCRWQHNDVIARVVSLGLQRRTRRGTRAGRRCRKTSINSTTGDHVTLQLESPSRSSEHDQLFNIFQEDHQRQFECPLVSPASQA